MPRSGGNFANRVAFGLILTILGAVFSHRSTSSSSTRDTHTVHMQHAMRHTSITRHAPPLISCATARSPRALRPLMIT